MGKRTVVLVAGLWFVVFAAIAACGGTKTSEDEGAAASESCLPGSVFSCVRWNCSGFQRCADDGSGLMPCTCNSTDAGDLLIDAGKSAMTGAQPPTAAARADAGAPRDAGTQAADAGTGTVDAGASTPAQNPGASPADAGASTQAQNPSADAGTTTSSEPADAGTPRAPDAGSIPTESCDNGQDDDADGLADCADPDCTETRCVPAAPQGWSGPVAFRVATEAVSCTGEFDRIAFEAGDQPEAEPATCSKCSCAGGGCGAFLEFGTSTDAACGGESCTTSVNTSCVEIRPQCLQNATTASLKTRLPSGTGCAPAKQEPSITPTRWKTRVTACESSAPQRTGCDAQALCLPTQPDNGFEAPYCIWRDGQHPCAGTAFPRQRVYYRGITDTRACSDCSCAAPGCNYSWQVYNVDDLSCTMPLLQVSVADQCAQINPENGRLRVGATITGDGACTASGGQSRGTVTPQDAITMCCDN